MPDVVLGVLQLFIYLILLTTLRDRNNCYQETEDQNG